MKKTCKPGSNCAVYLVPLRVATKITDAYIAKIKENGSEQRVPGSLPQRLPPSRAEKSSWQNNT